MLSQVNQLANVGKNISERTATRVMLVFSLFIFTVE